MPSTNLQSQLSSIKQKTNVQKPSLLFNSSAKVDLDVLFNLAKNGLAQLCLQNPSFDEFSNTIFSESLKDGIVELSSKEELDQVKKSVDLFLLQLSPYFLHACSFKVLEYLIRRFKINQYNMDKLIECILPFHDSKQFLQVVQTLDLGQVSKYSQLLSPLKNSNKVTLDRQLIVQKCVLDKALLQGILDMTSASVDHSISNQPLWSFFSATVLHFLSIVQVSDDVAARTFLPILFKLSSKKAYPDLMASSFMIFAQLSQRVLLSSQVVKSVFKAIVENVPQPLEHLALLTILTICQSQNSSNISFDGIYAAILNFSEIQQAIVKMSRAYQIEKFIIPLVKSLVHESNSKPGNYLFLSDLLKLDFGSYKLPDELISLVCDDLISKCMKDSGSSNNLVEMRSLLWAIQAKNSDVLNASFEKAFKSIPKSNTGKRAHKALYNFISSTFQGTVHQPVTSTTNIYLGVQHADENIRFISVTNLKSIVVDMKNNDPELLQSILLERLGDCSSRIVEQILGFDGLVDIVQHSPLGQALIAVAKKYWKSYSLVSKCLEIILELLANSTSLEVEIEAGCLEILFGSFFVTRESRQLNQFAFGLENGLIFGKKVDFSEAKKQLTETFETFKTSKDESKFIKGLGEINLAVAEEVAVVFPNLHGISKFMALSKSTFSACKLFSLSVIYSLASKTQDDLLNVVCGFVQQALPVSSRDTRKCTFDCNDGKFPSAFLDVLVSLKSNNLGDLEYAERGFFFLILQRILSQVKQPSEQGIWSNGAQATEKYRRLVVSLFSLVAAEFENFEECSYILKTIIIVHLKGNLLQFVYQIIAEENYLASVKTFALEMARSYIVSYLAKKPHTDFQLFLPVLLISIQNESLCVRQKAIECLEVIEASYSNIQKSGLEIFAYDQFFGPSSEHIQYLTLGAVKKFTNALVIQKQGFAADRAFLSDVLGTVLANDAEDNWQSTVVLFISTCILAVGGDFSRIKLLASLSAIDQPLKLQTIFPILEEKMNADILDSSSNKLLSSLVTCFSDKTVSTLFGAKSKKYLKAFVKLISCQTPALVIPSLAGLNLVTQSWFSGLSSHAQRSIFPKLLDLTCHSESVVAVASKNAIKKFELNDVLVNDILVKLHVYFQEESDEHKRLKPDEEAFATKSYLPLLTITSLLEIIAAKQVTRMEMIVPSLFDILGDVILIQSNDLPVSIEYLKQLILSTLADFIKMSDENLLDKSAIRVEHVVQCIKDSDNPQTRNASLLLIAAIANIHPTTVLVNIMPIFIFVGSSLTIDDSYSFHVIRQTLEIILPALLKKYRAEVETPIDLINSIKPVIKIFVDALPHVPKHRRLRLFTVLISVLGESEFLGSFVSLLLASHVFSGNDLVNANSVNAFEFSVSLSSQFDVEVQLKMVLELLDIVHHLPDDVESPNEAPLMFSSDEFSLNQLKSFKSTVIMAVIRTLTNKMFVSKLEKFENIRVLEAFHVSIMEAVFSIIAKFKRRDLIDTLKPSYCDGILEKMYIALEKVHLLLPLSSFVNVMGKLLVNEDLNIVIKTITLINDKFGTIAADPEVSDELCDVFIPLVPSLIKIASAENLTANKLLDENKQMSFLCLTTMNQKIGKRNADVFFTALAAVTDGVLSENKNISTSAITAVTSLCVSLGPRVLSYMPKFMPAILSIISSSVADPLKNGQIYVLSAMSSLTIIVKTFPRFISPFIPTLVKNVLNPAFFKSDKEEETMHLRIFEKAEQLRATMTTHVPIRILFPALFNELTNCSENGLYCLISLYKMVSKAVSNADRADLFEQNVFLFKFFLKCFEFRGTFGTSFDNHSIDIIENEMITSFLQFVIKLNESSFKPLFLKLVEWAIGNDPIKGKLELDKLCFFYKLLDCTLEKLKSIIVPFMGYVLDNSIRVLDAYSKGIEEISVELWINVNKALHKCFLYDNDGFINAERFAKIYPSIIIQLDTLQHQGHSYMNNMTNYVIPCIGQLAVLVNSDALWKPLNQSVLMKSRSEFPAIRLATLKVVQELYSRLGEDLLVLLPETIPFLAELMEDDDLEVEKQCQKVCVLIEQYLGEPIQQYFNA